MYELKLLVFQFLSMPFWLQVFCGVMIFLTVTKCWIKKEKSENISKWHKVITSLIAIFTCLTGTYYLNNTLPSPASPQINHLFFFGNGDLQQFRYCCEFDIRNDGETPCSLQRVEYVLDGTEFKNAKTGQARVSSGGGGGARYGGRYGNSGGSVTIDVGSSYFPQSLSKMNQGFCVFGEAVNPNGGEINLTDTDEKILIRFHLKSRDKTFVEEREVSITYGNVRSVRF